ncbi:MAG: hypothetical protein ABJI62_00870, partial [Alphaproteobacteria bacterium]
MRVNALITFGQGIRTARPKLEIVQLSRTGAASQQAADEYDPQRTPHGLIPLAPSWDTTLREKIGWLKVFFGVLSQA